jgi:hypothetical protein
MRKLITHSCAIASLALATSTSAQDAKAKPDAQAKPPAAAPPQMTKEQMAEMEAYQKAGTPGPQHERLARAAGKYTTLVRSWNEPGGPPIEETGTVTRTMSLGGRVLVEEFNCKMMGMPFTGSGLAGYDNVSGKHWSTWTDSMSTGIMLSEGTCDAKDSCAYTGSWNDPITKGKITARMTSRWTSPTVQVFEMYTPGKDGKEMKMMEITYTKQ